MYPLGFYNDRVYKLTTAFYDYMLFPVNPVTGKVDFLAMYPMPAKGMTIFHTFYNDMIDSLVFWSLWFQQQLGLAQQLLTNSYNGLSIVQQYPNYFPASLQQLNYAYYGEPITTSLMNALIRAINDVYRIKKSRIDSFKQAVANYLKNNILPNINTIYVKVMNQTSLYTSLGLFKPLSGTPMTLIKVNNPYRVNFLTVDEAKIVGNNKTMIDIFYTPATVMPYVPWSIAKPMKNAYLLFPLTISFSTYKSLSNYTVVSLTYSLLLKVFLGTGYAINGLFMYASPPVVANVIGGIKFQQFTISTGKNNLWIKIDLGGLHTKHHYHVIQNSEVVKADFWTRLIENTANLAGGIMFYAFYFSLPFTLYVT